MTSRRTSHILKAIIGSVLSALIAVEPVLASAGLGALWHERRDALLSRPASLPPLPALPAHRSTVDELLEASPGRLIRTASSNNSARRTLVLIQDVHMNAEAQANIRQTVEKLLAAGGVAFVALEGASGDIDLSVKDKNVSDSILRSAADYLLRTGRISGAVHALLTCRTHRARAHGVEMPALYAANVRAAARGRAQLPDAERKLAALGQTLDALERRTFNPALMAFSDQARAAKAGAGLTPAFAALLLNNAPDASANASLRRYAEAAALETAFDGPRLEDERRRLMEELLPSLDDRERADLLRRAMAFRAGQSSQADLFRAIDALSRSRGISMSSFPALRAHLRYLELADSLDVGDLAREAREAERGALAALTRTDGERALIDAELWLGTATKLVHFALSRDEWKIYAASNAAAPAVFGGEAPDLAPFESFYRLATARDEALARDVENLFRTSGDGVGILVAGGFHTEGLARAFANDPPRLLTFTPRLTRDPGDPDAYFSVFTREKTPLDRLLDGERIFLANPPARLGILPEMIVMGEEAADPAVALANPSARLADLRGHGPATAVVSRDVWPHRAELANERGAFTSSFDASGNLSDITWMPRRPATDPYPHVEREITIVPPSALERAPSVDEVYGPLFARIQAWANGRTTDHPALFLRRIIDMRTRTISLRNIDKDPNLPISIYAGEAARLRRYFPGYRIIAENLQGLGAAKGMLREYDDVSGERFSLLPGFPVREKPFVSFQESVADAEQEASRQKVKSIDFSLGIYFYRVTAVVPPARPEDFEFLETFRPLQFLRAHRGTWIQQSLRAAGVFGIWAAMLAAPVALAYAMPVGWLSYAVVATGYFQIGTATGLAFANPQRRLERRTKVLLFLAYVPNVIAHGLYNRLVWFAPLSRDRDVSRDGRWAPGQPRADAATIARLVDQYHRITVQFPIGETKVYAAAQKLTIDILDAVGVLPHRGEGTVINLLDGPNRLVGVDRNAIGVDARAPPAREAQQILRDLYGIRNPSRRLAGYRFIHTDIDNPDDLLAQVALQPAPYVMFLHHVHYFYTWWKKEVGVSTAEAETDFINTMAALVHWISPAAIVTIEWTGDGFGEIYTHLLPKMGYRTALARLLGSERARQTMQNLSDEKYLHAITRSFNLAMGGAVDVYLRDSGGSLVARGTRRAYADRNIRAGRRGREAGLRLRFAPDFEFLRAFRPGDFLNDHDGTRAQQIVRAAGIALIWIAMLGAPLVAAHFLPFAWAQIAAVAVAYFQIGVAHGLALADPMRQLRPWQKALLFSAYVPNVLIHALYNLLVWFAPLTAEPTVALPGQGEEALAAWAQTNRGKKVPFTVAQIKESSGAGWNYVRTVLSTFVIETVGRAPSEGRQNMEAWAASHRGETLTENATVLAERFGLKRPMAQRILQRFQIKSSGKPKSKERQALETFFVEIKGQTVRESKQSIAGRFKVKVPVVNDAAAEFNVTIIDPEEEKLQQAKTNFRAWAEARKNTKVDRSVVELASDHAVPQYFVDDVTTEFSVQTSGAKKSPDRIRLEAWAAQHRNETVPETSTQLQIDYKLSYPTVDEVVAEYGITLSKAKRGSGESRRAAASFRDWAKARHGQTLDVSAPELGTQFGLASYLIGKIARSELITLKKIYHAAEPVIDAPVPATVDETAPPATVADVPTSAAAPAGPETAAAPEIPTEQPDATDVTRGSEPPAAVSEETVMAEPVAAAPAEHPVASQAKVDATATTAAVPSAATTDAGLAKFRKWAADREGETLHQTIAIIAGVHNVDEATVRTVLGEFRIKLPGAPASLMQRITEIAPEKAPKPAKAPKAPTPAKAPKPERPGLSVGDYLGQFEGKTIGETPAQLAARFDVPERLVQGMMISLGITWPKDGSLVTDDTRLAAGENAGEAWIRLVFAPDREFLRVFRPKEFLRAHQGTRAQQIARAVGIGGIWLAMIGAPLVAGIYLPSGLNVIALAVGTLQFAVAFGLARLDVKLRLPADIKAALFFVYLPNIIVHALYNLLVWFAPLTVDNPADVAARAWAESMRGQKTPTKKAELIRAFGYTDYAIRQLLKEFSITAGQKVASQGRKDLEAWAEPRRGTTITETTSDLATRHGISESLVLIVLGNFDITSPGKQKSQGRKNAEAWATPLSGKRFVGDRRDLAQHLGTNLSTMALVLKQFEIKVVSPEREAYRRRLKKFDTWAAQRKNKTIPQSTTALAEKNGILYRDAKKTLAKHGVVTPYAALSADAAPAVVTPPAWRPPEGARSLGDYLQEFENGAIDVTPEQLASGFEIEPRLVYAVIKSLNIRFPLNGGSLVSDATRYTYNLDNEARGRTGSEAELRLLYAPDREFLQTFRPKAFLADHDGTRRQQIARALGVAAIWIAMFGAPLAVAFFIPSDGGRLAVVAVAYLQIGIAYGVAVSTPFRKLAPWQKTLLFGAYVPNVFVHFLYNLLVWFAPLMTDAERDAWPAERDDMIRQAFESGLARLRAAFAADPHGEERAQRTLAHLWLRPASDDRPGLTAWRAALDHAVSSVIRGDVKLSPLAELHGLRQAEREEIDPGHDRATGRSIVTESPRGMASAGQANYFITAVRPSGAAINMARVTGDGFTSLRLIYEVRDHMMIITEIQKQGSDAAVSPAVTRELVERTIEAARAAGIASVRLATAGEIVDDFIMIPSYAAHLNYARLPWELGFRLGFVGSARTIYGLIRDLSPVAWELPLARPPEAPAARIERELAAVSGIFYYPAGGSDWKPFRNFLPRMPKVKAAFYADREYADHSPDTPFHKEDRARHLLEEEGFDVEELPGPRKPDHIKVSDARGRTWRVEYHRGDIVANTLGDIATPRVVARYGDVGYIHVERPGQGAALAIGRNSGAFHARLITQLRTGGLLGGYQRPAEEPLEFLQDQYERIGLERLGKDADGNVFLKKIRQVDAPDITRLIELDRDLWSLYQRVEYPYSFGWTLADQRQLGKILTELKASGLDEVAQSVRARFDEKFQMQIKIHKLNPDSFVIPMSRMVLFAALFTFGVQSGALWAEPMFRIALFGTGLLELSVMLATVIFEGRSKARTRAASESAALESRARVLVRAARALSRPGAPVSDELIQAALHEAAQRLGVAARRGDARADWATSFADQKFAAVIDRVIREEAAGGIDPEAARALVETLSGWGLPVDTSALVRPNVVVKVSGPADLARAADIERRLPGASILIWADRATALALAGENSRWPVAVYGENVFSDGAMKLRNVPDSLPNNFRDYPENLVFALPRGIAIDDAGLPADSAWRSVRLLAIDQVLGLLKVITMQQRMILDRVVEHLVAARQA